MTCMLRSVLLIGVFATQVLAQPVAAPIPDGTCTCYGDISSTRELQLGRQGVAHRSLREVRKERMDQEVLRILQSGGKKDGKGGKKEGKKGGKGGKKEGKKGGKGGKKADPTDDTPVREDDAPLLEDDEIERENCECKIVCDDYFEDDVIVVDDEIREDDDIPAPVCPPTEPPVAAPVPVGKKGKKDGKGGKKGKKDGKGERSLQASGKKEGKKEGKGGGKKEGKKGDEDLCPDGSPAGKKGGKKEGKKGGKKEGKGGKGGKKRRILQAGKKEGKKGKGEGKKGEGKKGKGEGKKGDTGKGDNTGKKGNTGKGGDNCRPVCTCEDYITFSPVPPTPTPTPPTPTTLPPNTDAPNTDAPNSVPPVTVAPQVPILITKPSGKVAEPTPPPTPSPTTRSPTEVPPTPPPTPEPSTLSPTRLPECISTCVCRDGDKITVEYVNPDPLPDDWVGLYKCKENEEDTYNYHPDAWLWGCYENVCDENTEPPVSNTLVFEDPLPEYNQFGPHKWPLARNQCYVALLSRNVGRSPPPYDLLCEGLEFILE